MKKRELMRRVPPAAGLLSLNLSPHPLPLTLLLMGGSPGGPDVRRMVLEGPRWDCPARTAVRAFGKGGEVKRLRRGENEKEDSGDARARCRLSLPLFLRAHATCASSPPLPCDGKGKPTQPPTGTLQFTELLPR